MCGLVARAGEWTCAPVFGTRLWHTLAWRPLLDGGVLLNYLQSLDKTLAQDAGSGQRGKGKDKGTTRQTWGTPPAVAGMPMAPAHAWGPHFDHQYGRWWWS